MPMVIAFIRETDIVLTGALPLATCGAGSAYPSTAPQIT